ncbi:MAG: GTP diphosphokinase [Thiohalophilus sp.]
MVSVTRKHPEIAAGSPVDIDAWLDSLQANYSAAELEQIRQAAALSRQAHEGQSRASGEPYFMHSLAVAQILTELNLDANSISAAILHDVVEDTRFTLDELQTRFGEDVAHLVDGVTKMDIIATLRGGDLQEQKEHLQAENLRKMLLAMAEDVRVVLIKLADRLHNMRTLSALPADKQRRIARETMDIFAPLANRLGIWQLKWELEDLAFRYLRPTDYKQIAEHLAERRNEREHYLTRFVDQLQRELDSAGIQAEVKGRIKHIYGIWKKMQHKQQAFHQIYDVRAVRVYVETVPACYAALGIVHTLWNYLPGEFDDYIATPKENNYRSIHTAVIGPEGKTVEVQIRTWDMHQESEYGIAAHWRYKEGVKSNQAFDEKIAWLRQLLEWKEDIAEAGEFVDQFKSEVFADRVYVFTPRGNIIDLPAGATPLDFAYRIHTEVGHRCRGAKVNGRMVSLTQPLHTGDQVEILSVKKGGPSRDWMNPQLGYLVTSKARQQVQRWFKLQNLDQNIADGRMIVERELKRLGFSNIGYEKLANQMGYKQVDEFLAALGRGDIKPGRIATAAHHLSEPAPQNESEAPLLRKPRARPATSDIEVHGVGDLLTKFARCCKPVPGDAIVGFITQGQGVSIHRRDCHNVLRAIADHPERFVEVEWGRSSSSSYPVDIEIQAYDRQGLLRDITTLLANAGVDVTAVHTQSHKQSHTATLTITAEVPDIDALSTVLARINQLSNVTEVRRKTK